MKRSLVVAFSVVLVACLAACSTANNEAGKASEKSATAEASAKAESTEGSADPAAEESAEKTEGSEKSEAEKVSHMIDSYKDGDTIDIISSDIYTYLYQPESAGNVCTVETVTMNADGILGKKGQTEEHYYNFSGDEYAVKYFTDDKCTSVMYTDYKENKTCFCNPEVNKYFTQEALSGKPEKFESPYLIAVSDKKFTVKDGWYVVTTDETTGYTLSFRWNDEKGGVQVVAKAGDETSLDADISVVTGSDENVSLLDGELKDIKTMLEVEPPEQFKSLEDGETGLTDMSLYSMFDGSYLNDYWENAKAVSEAGADSSES